MGKMGLENGKIYEVYECAETMYNNMYIAIDDRLELVDDNALANDPLYSRQTIEKPNYIAIGIGISAGIAVIVAGITAFVKKKKKSKAAQIDQAN